MSSQKITFDKKEYPLQDETYLLNGIAMEIHRILGRGFLEIVYKDAFELELRNRGYRMSARKNTLLNTKGLYSPIDSLQILSC